MTFELYLLYTKTS